jgi:alkylation response protein AidB-like acyl-CoA dehydrogenase
MISFEPSEEQQLVRDTVASFAREQIRPAAREADESGDIPEGLVQQAWELGLVQSTIPESFGGFGDQRSAMTSALVCEELGWAISRLPCTCSRRAWRPIRCSSSAARRSVRTSCRPTPAPPLRPARRR